MFHPNGLRPHVRSWARTGPILIGRLRREAAAYPGSPSKNLLRELLQGTPTVFIPGIDDAPLAPTVALELEIGDEVLRLFNTLTTFGTPQDVTLQELRIEMSFPADDASDALLRHWLNKFQWSGLVAIHGSAQRGWANATKRLKRKVQVFNRQPLRRFCWIPLPHFEVRFCPLNASVTTVFDGQL